MSAKVSPSELRVQTQTRVFDKIVRQFKTRPEPMTFNELRKHLKHMSPRQKDYLGDVFGDMVQAGLFEKIPSTPGTPGRPTTRYRYVG